VNVLNSDVMIVVCGRRSQQLDNTVYAGGGAGLCLVRPALARCRRRQQVRDDVTRVLRRTVRRQQYLVRDSR